MRSSMALLAQACTDLCVCMCAFSLVHSGGGVVTEVCVTPSSKYVWVPSALVTEEERVRVCEGEATCGGRGYVSRERLPVEEQACEGV